MSERLRRDAILIVDDEIDFAKGLARLIAKGFAENPVVVKHNGPSALELLQERPCALLITDLNMPGMDGFALLEKAIALEPALSVVILTGYGTIETAVAALKAGAYDFVTKPIDVDGLYRVVTKGLDHAALLRENRRLREAIATWGPRNDLIGDSPAMIRLREEIQAVAATDYTVLITGESGSGKELVARNIHRLSSRSEHPLVSVNCTAIPEHLLESELFGHAKGAFTGADKARQGLFVAADGSTLHLDEIGDLPPQLQPKLLRALQEKEVRPVGGAENIPVNVRILASTNQRLRPLMAAGTFREDLYYRLNVLTIRVPSLGERQTDIPLLVLHCLHATSRELNTGEKELTPDAFEYLTARRWQGNVRELFNFVRRVAVFCRGNLVTQSQLRLLDTAGKATPRPAQGLETYKEAKERFLEDFTRSYVARLLDETGGNISQAARVSGLERVSLQKILRRLDIHAGAYRKKTE